MFRLIGALIPSLLISRLLFWLGRRLMKGAYPNVFLVNGISFVICVAIFALGSTDGEPIIWTEGIVYFVPQILWLILDYMRTSKGKPPFLFFA